VLIDTPTSDLIDVAPKGSDTLAGRATLLANLMVDGVVEDQIAKRAGLDPDKLVGLAADADADPTAPTPGPRDYVLTTGVALTTSGDQLPIITIDTQAPDVKGAERLANAAIAGLTAYLDSQATAQSVPQGRRLRVTGLGPAQAGVGERGPSHALSLIATILIFSIGCTLLLVFHAVLRDWNATSYDDALDLYPDEGDLETPPPLALVPGSDDAYEDDPEDDWPAGDWLASHGP
jgi:hypothetical protein